MNHLNTINNHWNIIIIIWKINIKTGVNAPAQINSLNSRLGLLVNGLYIPLKLNFCERMSKNVGTSTVLMSSDTVGRRFKSIPMLLMKRELEKLERKYRSFPFDLHCPSKLLKGQRAVE